MDYSEESNFKTITLEAASKHIDECDALYLLEDGKSVKVTWGLTVQKEQNRITVRTMFAPLVPGLPALYEDDYYQINEEENWLKSDGTHDDQFGRFLLKIAASWLQKPALVGGIGVALNIMAGEDKVFNEKIKPKLK